jgi:multiple sugar transport system permease protein
MSKYKKYKRSDIKWACFFLAPLMIGLAVFYVYSFGLNLFYSFTDLGPFGKFDWVGLANYKRLLHDRYFYMALMNTLEYVVISVPAIVAFSVVIAALLNSKIKGKGIYRTLIFIPAITMPAAIGILWRWLYNYQYGLVNVFLGKLGIEHVAWLSDDRFVVPAISLVIVWSMVSYQMLIVLAGLQNIPKVYYEAATIDGAGTFRKFFCITIPLLTPTIFFVAVITVINIFQVFDFIFLMIPKGSAGVHPAMSLVYYFYNQSFVRFDKGYGAAISIILFAIIFIVTWLQFKIQKRWVHY